ncbi:arsenate reductase (glutaredoxin) [Ottowia testudinis]|uniref:Arsenate reductase n=1 Tax=Ottowia testudinis TaxID=2816950 RepID=A0A975CFA4_9BURK|nr:arsenate reductase (glutaredoxin) [Ottowia testudinis]QTD44484.1 arsenate reductase (glutaredoxin) [Ottowia testudinis]
MNPITIYHNPQCGTSRNVLAMIRAGGEQPNVVEYLKTPPSRDELKAIAAATGEPLRALLRTKQPQYLAQGLDNPALTDDQLADAMVATPVLINRPIVVTPRGTRLCRPSEAVLDILPQPLTQDFVKEDGEVVPARPRS